MRQTGAGEAAARAMQLLRLAGPVLVDLFEPFGHVFHLAEKGRGDKQRTFLRGHEREASTGPRVDLDQLATQFILLLENEPGEVSRILQLRDDGTLNRDVEAFENGGDEVMSQRPFLRRVVQEHPDDLALLV